ncbi:hypothetical protein [Sinorhizobium fredii]|uniref:hypothetical protein n=1 Tax=Rhizobium fredii TaxID=380 RepID=UPI0013E8DAFF|nr:hypothetical protein [Sinorhizobium fredii]
MNAIRLLHVSLNRRHSKEIRSIAATFGAPGKARDSQPTRELGPNQPAQELLRQQHVEAYAEFGAAAVHFGAADLFLEAVDLQKEMLWQEESGVEVEHGTADRNVPQKGLIFGLRLQLTADDENAAGTLYAVMRIGSGRLAGLSLREMHDHRHGRVRKYLSSPPENPHPAESRMAAQVTLHEPTCFSLAIARATTMKMAGFAEIRQKNLAMKTRCH